MMAKKQRGNWQNPDEFDELGGLSIDEPLTESVYIDMDEINDNAKKDSLFMLKDLAKIYGNEKFMNEHPEYKKRLDLELESIRVLLKMRRSDEISHDILVKQIGLTPNVASMYAALQKLQSAMVSIENKLDDKVKTVNNLLKNYQMEIPFEEEKESEDTPSSSGSLRYRGSKQFIMDMQNETVDTVSEPVKLPVAGTQYSLFEDDPDDSDPSEGEEDDE